MSRTVCLKITPLYVFLIIITISQTIVLIPLILYGILKSLKLKLPKLFLIIYCVTSFVLLLAAISRPIHHILECKYSVYCDDLNRISITGSLTISSYMLSLVCISTLYLFRLKLAFENSPYSLSKCAYILNIIVLLILLILSVVAIELLVKIYHALKYDPANYANAMFKFFWVWVLFGIFQIIYNLILVMLFAKKMVKLSKTGKNKQVINNVMDSVAMCVLCLILTFLSTLIAFSFGWIRGNFVTDSNELYIINVIMISSDVFINALCINLQFQHSKIIFDKYCKCCYHSLISYFMGVSITLNKHQKNDTFTCTTTSDMTTNEVTSTETTMRVDTEIVTLKADLTAYNESDWK